MSFEEEPVVFGRDFIIFGIFALIWYFVNQEAGFYTIKKPLFEIILVFLALVVGKLATWVSRYHMGWVATNNFAGSILGDPIVLKDAHGIRWAVFNTGVSLYPVPMQGKLATLILPFEQINKSGKNYVARTFVKRTPVRMIPPVVYKFLMHNKSNYNTTEVFYGKYDQEFMHENPKTADYEQREQDLFSQINLRGDLLEGRNDEFTEMHEFAKELTGQNKGILGWLKPEQNANQ